jgi:serine/threonine protein kinase
VDAGKDGGASTRFGKYQLLRRLAAGRVSEVHLAQEVGSASPRKVALKRMFQRMSDNKAFIDSLNAETRVAAQLSHPNIAKILDFGHLDGRFYIAAEFVAGLSLDQLARVLDRKRRRMPAELAARVMACVCDALSYANTQAEGDGQVLGLVHRGLSPSSVMITREGGVKVLDFGLANALAQLPRAGPGIGKGKFQYVAPGASSGQDVDARSDLFSVGVMLYEMTTGQTPFEGETAAAVAMAIRQTTPKQPATLIQGYPQALSDIVMRALDKDRERRFRDAWEMKLQLEDFLVQSGLPSATSNLAALVSEFLVPPRRASTPSHSTRPPPPRVDSPPPEMVSPPGGDPSETILREELPAGVFDDAEEPAPFADEPVTDGVATPMTVVDRPQAPSAATAAFDVDVDVFGDPPENVASAGSEAEVPLLVEEVPIRNPGLDDEIDDEEVDGNWLKLARKRWRTIAVVLAVLVFVFVAATLVRGHRAAPPSTPKPSSVTPSGSR